MRTWETQRRAQELTGLPRTRHEKYGNTIFHLEPNIKDGPGGLRDYQVACWLAKNEEMGRSREWKDAEELLPTPLRSDAVKAIDFLDAVRCFLHYRQGRDLNGLTYELQLEAASAGIGLHGGVTASASDWMRIYFRHARAIHRLAVLLDEVPQPKSLWTRLFGRGKSPLSTAEFTVVDGRVSLRQPEAIEDPAALFRLFELVARHNVKLTPETETALKPPVPHLPNWPPTTSN